MSSEVDIRVRNLSKVYRIYERPEDRLIQMATLGRVRRFTEFWALHDVSLDIHRGETVGIIGRNGCGKSTLLQIICGTLQPTSGTVEVKGRIAALLELGAGFNGEFTGRENVYMNGAILGFSKEEMDARFGQIAEFAGIGDFIERPVKTYSSGMFVRLAFAVATAVEPDILVVDEALAVGDEAFQRKCFARIEAIKERGGTILFVSHGAQTIVQLCDRAVLLDRGEKLLEGSPRLVVAQYQRLVNLDAAAAPLVREEIKAIGRDGPLVESLAQEDLAAHHACAGLFHFDTQPEETQEAAAEDWFDENLVSESEVSYEPRGARILNIQLEDMSGKRVNVLTRGRTYRLVYDIAFDGTETEITFGFLIKTVTGIDLAGGKQTVKATADGMSGVWHAEITFACPFVAGTYFVNAGVLGGEGDYLHRRLDALAFRVQPQTHDNATGYLDVVRAMTLHPAKVPALQL